MVNGEFIWCIMDFICKFMDVKLGWVFELMISDFFFIYYNGYKVYVGVWFNGVGIG